MSTSSKRPRPDTTPTMRIGELARLSGRSVHTIRWYEAQGLIPGAARDSAGRRLFSEMHVAWLDLLTRLRDSDMSIRDMKAYARLVQLGKPTLSECRDLLTGHREKVVERAQALKQTLSLLDKKIAIYDGWISRQ